MKWKKVLIDYIGITVGSLIVAVALDMFLIPNKIAAGGVSGAGVVLFHLTGISVGMTMLVINIPLFATGIKEMGWAYGLKSLYGAILLSVAVDLLAPILPNPTTDFFLASIFGGLLTGVGVGIVFLSRGSTGGTVLAAALLNKTTGLALGRSLLLIDGLVVLWAGITFNLELAMWALVTIFVTSKVVDTVQEGSLAKAAFIISEQHEEISQRIMEEMDRGGTGLKGRGLYTKTDREIILTVVSQNQITRLKDIVYEIDHDAFVIVTDVREVLGEGFQRRKIKKKKALV